MASELATLRLAGKSLSCLQGNPDQAVVRMQIQTLTDTQ